MVKRHEHMTEAEARRALYVDFEGPKDGPPILIGVLRKRVQQYVVDAMFAPAGPNHVELLEAVRGLVARAERKDRRIVSWSEHDLKIAKALESLDHDLVKAFEARWVNGLRLAERWASRSEGVKRPKYSSLENYLDLIDFSVPIEAEPGHVGDTIRQMRPTLEGCRQITKNQSEHWANLLEHNRFDCVGMKTVCVRATSDIDRQDEQARAGKKSKRKRRHGKHGSASARAA